MKASVVNQQKKQLLSPDKSSKQQETPAFVLSLNKIKTWLSNGRFVTTISFLYKVLILILLIYIAAKPNDQPGFSLASTPQCGPPCPRSWIGYNEKCYYFSEEKRNWTSSRDYCSSHNAFLARIEKEEMDFVRRLKGKDFCWIGLHRVLNKEWTWTDGENAMVEVTGGGGDCAFLDNTDKTIASGCHTKLSLICSKPAAYTTNDITDT